MSSNERRMNHAAWIGPDEPLEPTNLPLLDEVPPASVAAPATESHVRNGKSNQTSGEVSMRDEVETTGRQLHEFASTGEQVQKTQSAHANCRDERRATSGNATCPEVVSPEEAPQTIAASNTKELMSSSPQQHEQVEQFSHQAAQRSTSLSPRQDHPQSPSIPSPTTLLFHAVRKCDSLRGPAVFLDWDDCSFYIDQEENESKVDYKSFQLMEDAMRYIAEYLPIHCVEHTEPDPRTTTAATAIVALATTKDVATCATKNTNKITTATATTTATAPATATVIATSTATATATVSDAQLSSRNKRSSQDASLVDLATRKKTPPPPVAWMSQEDGNLVPLYTQPDVVDLVDESTESPTATITTTNTTSSTSTSPLTTVAPSNASKRRKKYTRRDFPMRKEKFDTKFDECITLLQEYKEKYGTCDVPMTNKYTTSGKFEGLGMWVKHIRQQFRTIDENPDGCILLDENQIRRLMDMNFVVKPARGRKLQTAMELGDTEWDVMMNELRAFKEAHGHANVPDRPTSKLRNWLLRQRKHYAKLKEGKPTPLTAQKISQLTELGFSFKAQTRYTFDERALQWLEHKTKYGRDPKRYSEDGLGKWVGEMRAKYEALNSGKPTNLTREQAQRLTDWGFRWTSGMKKPVRKQEGPNKSWETRLEELVAYKEEHGDTLVPQLYPGLGYWVHKQRTEYKKFLEAKKSIMTKEKLDKLNEIDFAFEARRGGKRPDGTSPCQQHESKEGFGSDAEEDSEGSDEDVAVPEATATAASAAPTTTARDGTSTNDPKLDNFQRNSFRDNRIPNNLTTWVQYSPQV